MCGREWDSWLHVQACAAGSGIPTRPAQCWGHVKQAQWAAHAATLAIKQHLEEGQWVRAREAVLREYP